LIDDLKVVEDLLQLPLANLKENLLLIFKIHLNIEYRLLDSFLLFGRDLDIEAPVEISKFLEATAEFILHVLFCGRCVFTEELENCSLQLLLESSWELISKDILIEHGPAADVLFHQVV
jgi:hypothetical protein